MESRKVKCRTCGKLYTPCKSAFYNPDVFNWKEVACSYECGQEYLAQVIASRTPAVEKTKQPSRKKRAAEEE